MTTPKLKKDKGERVDKEKEKEGDKGLMQQPTGQIQKTSASGEGIMKEILKEIQGISAKQDVHQEELKKLSEKQDEHQKELQKMRKEMSEDLNAMKKEIQVFQQEMKVLKEEKQVLANKQEQCEKRLEDLTGKSLMLEKQQEKLETSELEFQLRFRNIAEDPKEDIRQIVIELTAKLMECPEEVIEKQIDREYDELIIAGDFNGVLDTNLDKSPLDNKKKKDVGDYQLKRLADYIIAYKTRHIKEDTTFV
ncbi:tropomyosin beta chain-like [Anolis sagrei]|uniref:tropomyosin beta chain-like n=1 Tax=Anolis sagrei TaxID=38937 RepID=UPI003522A9A8